jgi:hypothetical protein
VIDHGELIPPFMTALILGILSTYLPAGLDTDASASCICRFGGSDAGHRPAALSGGQAPLAATAGVSAAWLAAVITVLCGWSAAFAWRVYRSGRAERQHREGPG